MWSVFKRFGQQFDHSAEWLQNGSGYSVWSKPRN